MYNQDEYIYNEFINNFSDTKEPMAIYGIGIAARNLVSRIPEYNIVGLMDGKRKTGTIWNKAIIDTCDVVELGVKKIVIIARPAVIGVIYHRISSFAKENHILVMDVHGRDLSEEFKLREYDIPYYHKSWNDLTAECDKHAIVTFDIFDTLLVRKTMQPKDVFDIVERKMKKEDSYIELFSEIRKRAEESWYDRDINPTIFQIYDEIQRLTGISDRTKEQYLKMELDTEFQVIEPRKSMLKFYNTIKGNKEIYLISDMYLPKDFLDKILKECGYEGYKDIYVSCEYNCSKQNGLFQEFLKVDPTRKEAIHIGDNSVADGECARNAGIETFEIMSEKEMLESSVYNVVLEKECTLMDRIAIGLFCWKAFDDPFTFCGTNGKLKLDDHKEIAYLFVAPEIIYFVCWLMKSIIVQGCDYVLYPSRDAYILEKICNVVKEEQKLDQYPDGKYIYTSRRSMFAASVFDKKDIDYVSTFEYYGSMNELFEERFNLKIDEMKNEALNDEKIQEIVSKYKEDILSICRKERTNYRKYLKEIGVLQYKNLAFIDFVAAGTIQNGLRKVIPENDLVGFYFLKRNTGNDELENELKVKSFYEPLGDYQLEANIYKFYLFFEMILTSPEPTFNCIEDNGKPCFEEEMRDNLHMKVVGEMQGEIMTYARDISAICPELLDEEVSRDFSDQLVGFMGKEFSEIASEEVISLVLTDKFLSTKHNIFDR